MKRPELYNKTVDILVQAYFNDTLVHGNQCGCAVGNIVAANCGIRIKGKGDNLHWTVPSMISGDAIWFTYIQGDIMNDHDGEKAEKQISITGYNVSDIIHIERAFENALFGNSDDEWMFNGLMAVIDVLDQIHENTDTIITTSTKQKFNKQLASHA